MASRSPGPAGAGEQPRRGLSPLAWIGIVLGGVVVLMGVACLVGGYFFYSGARDFVADVEENPALAAARMMVAADPDLELVETDAEAGTITVRNTETGEVVTLDLEDIEEGRLGIASEAEGMALEFGAAAELPGWIPAYPGSDPESVFAGRTAEGVSGTFVARTGDEVDEVVAFYEAELRGAGFEVQVSRMGSAEAGVVAVVWAADEAAGRSVTVSVTAGEDATEIMIAYEEQGGSE